MNKKYMAFAVLGVLAFAIVGVGAYQLLTITFHYSSTETQVLSYSDDGVTFNALTPETDNDLGAYTIGVGESQDTYLRGDSSANREIMYTYSIDNADALVKYDFQCSQSGVEYNIVSGQVWGEGIVVNVKVPASSQVNNIIQTTLSAEAPISETFDKIIVPSRGEVDSSIIWSVCP